MINNAALTPTTGLVTGNVWVPSQSLPPTKTTLANYFVVYAVDGLNYYEIMPISTVATPPAYAVANVGLSPIQAFNMDSKLDDGLPNSGIVIAKSTTAVNAAPSANVFPTPNTCLLGTGGAATDSYNRTASSGGNDGSCSLRFRMN